MVSVSAVLAATEIDTDSDGLPDVEETHIGTNLEVSDSDNDGYADGEEVLHGYDPLALGGDKLKKRIEVSIKNQDLHYFLGEYLVNTFKVSTGLPGHDTPVGTFSVLKKFPKIDYIGAGYSYLGTKWNLRFKPGVNGNYYIHGAYWHNSFGKKRSHGCVNVSYANVERLYNFADEGTPVLIRN